MHIQSLTAGFLFALWPVLVEVAIVSLSMSMWLFRPGLSHSQRKFHNSYSSVVNQEERRSVPSLNRYAKNIYRTGYALKDCGYCHVIPSHERRRIVLNDHI